jgi:hypothetical protein
MAAYVATGIERYASDERAYSEYHTNAGQRMCELVGSKHCPVGAPLEHEAEIAVDVGFQPIDMVVRLENQILIYS